MKKLLTCFALLLCAAGSTPGMANDSAITGVSGTPGNMKAMQLAGEHRSIRMVRETVSMTIGRTDYVTDAHFEFRNDGAATSVKMGFPESGGGDANGVDWRRETSFKSFRTWVDGREIKATRLIAHDNDAVFTAFWVKTVSFKRGQTRHVRVLYRSPLGGSTSGDFVAYDFTGGNWKGRVAQSDLSVKFTVPGQFIVAPYYGDTRPKEWRTGNAFHFRWRNWQAQTEFNLRYLAELPGAMTRAEKPQDLKTIPDNALGAKKVHLLTVASPDKNFDPYRGPSFMPAGYLLRDGRIYVAVRYFYESLQYDNAARKEGEDVPPWTGTFVWNDKTRAAVFTTGGARNKTVQVGANAKAFSVDGFEYEFLAPTFIGGQGERSALYAPLSDLVAALGGKLEANLRTRRVWYQFPQ